MKTLVFADLDDTLFQSHHKQPPQADWLPVAYLKDGSPISFQSPGQQHLFETFLEAGTIIPVTARNSDAFARVDLPFTSEAIINYGGVILGANRTPEPQWLARTIDLAARSRDDLAQWQALVSVLAQDEGLSARVRLIDEMGMAFYVVAKATEPSEANEAALERIAAHLAPLIGNDARIHQNSNNLAILPRWLDKRDAVAHLIERYRDQHGHVVTIGIGDSLVDLGFMTLCDYVITPSGSQITTRRLGDHP